MLRWSIVVPVKRLPLAKSRLAPFAGAHRAALAQAMALDTVTAALACARVVEVIAVTDDPTAAAALSTLGARVVADVPDAGLNPALSHGAMLARTARAVPVAALSADLPALRAPELDAALAAAARHPTSFVADAEGSGTTAYCVGAGAEFAPRFGVGSAAAHRGAGAVPLQLLGIPTVRRDVDTEQDLRAAAALGVGPHTGRVLARLPAFAR